MEDRSKAKEVSTVILQALRSEGPVVTIERAEVYTDADGDTMSLTLLSQSGSRRTSASAPAIMEVSSTVVAASAASAHVSQSQTPLVSCESGSQTVCVNEPPRLNDEARVSTSSDYDNYPTSAAVDVYASAGNNGEQRQEASNHDIMEADCPRIGSAEIAAAARRSSSSMLPLTTFEHNEALPSSPRSDDVVGEGQEVLLDAEVEFTAPPPPSSSSSPTSPPRSPMRRRALSGSEGPILCGVPVAQLISADYGSDRDEDDVEEEEASATNNSENSMEDAEVKIESSHDQDASMHPHLQYLGPNVVIATMDEEGGVEQGQAKTGEERSSQPSKEGDHQDSINLNKFVSGGRKGYLWGGVILVALVVSVAVGIVRGTQRHKDDHDVEISGAEETPPTVDMETTTASQKPSPTFSPISQSHQHTIMMQLLNPFLQSTGSNAHRVHGSPQHQAVEWLDATSFGLHNNFNLTAWIDRGEETAGPLPTEQEERLIQRYALAVLYYSTMGPLTEEEEDSGWIDNSNFLSDNHECEWSSSKNLQLGVTCDDNLHVSEINLQDNNLSGVLPPNELHGLTQLRKMDLSYNSHIWGPLPEDLGGLPNLQILLLGHNALTGTLPSTYGNLTQLREFSLVDNILGGSIPAEVSNMTSLTNIWLNQNGFTDGMNNFCQEDIEATIFYADCFCRNFPQLKSEVKCTCCTICCAKEDLQENCHPNVPCIDG